MTQQKRKMDRGNMMACLRKALYHVGESKVRLIIYFSDDLETVLKNRFRIQREDLEEVIARIERITEIATQQNNQEILAVLNEEFEFGIDLPEN